MSRFLIICLAATCILIAGCGAMFNGSSKTIEIQGSPSGAKIAANPEIGEFTLPTSLSLERKHSYVLTFTKEGYKETKVQIHQNAQFGLIVLDVLFTGLIGVVVDAATGSWNNLTPDQISVNLEKTTVGVEGPDKIQVTFATHNGKTDSTESLDLNSTESVSVRVQQK